MNREFLKQSNGQQMHKDTFIITSHPGHANQNQNQIQLRIY